MLRLIVILLAIALTVFAIADWASRSRSWTPGGLNRWLWLAVILLLPIVGPLTWIIVGLVARAEASQASGKKAESQTKKRPDDDPDAISDVADRIARRQKRSRPANPPPPRKKNDGEDEEKDEEKSD